MARPCKRCEYENTDEAKFCLQCGAMLEQEAADGGDPLIGRILLGRYRVAELLGEGGMGKVYLAEQKMGTATRKVAIKTLHPELSSDPQIVARFHRECETVIELHHPNTVQFYDFGELDDKTLIIVMEYIKGEDLAHRLQRAGALQATLADKLLIQICGSLNEAHQRGIVHRDLKPENVLLTTRGGQIDFVKVLDFGIAKRNEAEDESRAKLTKQGMVLGTPPYMSPEQFSGQTLDARSDIYSLGIMSYEMVSGKLPFEARTPWEWATKHLTEPPAPIDGHAAAAALPPNKRNAIMRALSKNRDERQASVLAFMHEFTGLHDPQAAWTMATSLGGASASSSGVGANVGSPRAPVGTPQPMPSHGSPQSGQVPLSGATPIASHGAPPSGQFHPQATPGPMDFSSTTIPTNHMGKWVAALLVLFIALGGAVGGGVWWYSQKQATTTAATNPPTTPPSPPVSPVATAMSPVAEPVAMAMTETMDSEPAMVVEPTMEAAMEPTMEAVMEAQMHAAMTTSMAGNSAQAASLARNGENALRSNNFSGAITALRNAERAGGRSDSSVRRLRTALATRASNRVGILMQQGKCSQAQQLFRDLRRVRADRPSRVHFGDWCRRP